MGIFKEYTLNKEYWSFRVAIATPHLSPLLMTCVKSSCSGKISCISLRGANAYCYTLPSPAKPLQMPVPTALLWALAATLSSPPAASVSSSSAFPRLACVHCALSSPGRIILSISVQPGNCYPSVLSCGLPIPCCLWRILMCTWSSDATTLPLRLLPGKASHLPKASVWSSASSAIFSAGHASLLIEHVPRSCPPAIPCAPPCVGFLSPCSL